jgi:carbamoyltransferase
MYVLGINLSHDRSTALVKDGKIVVAIAEERLDRIKHSIGRLYWTKDKLGAKVLPWLGISYCLKEAGIGLDDLDLIVVDHAYSPVDIETLRSLIPIKNPCKICAIPHPSHHLAHAYSSFFCSPFEESAVLVVDHIGSLVSMRERESVSGYYMDRDESSLVYRQLTSGREFEAGSDSPSSFYRIITLLLGFVNPVMDQGQSGTWLAQYDDAGKTMGLAPYGRHRKNWEPWVTTDAEGMPTYIKLMDWLDAHGLLETVDDAKSGIRFPRLGARKAKAPLTTLHKDLAYKVQEEFERAMLLLTRRLHELTGSENICLAGGSALNTVCNRKIADQGLFKEIFVQPAATDDGNAIGAAIYGYRVIAGGKERHRMNTAYLGRKYSDAEIRLCLRNFSLHASEKIERKELLKFVAQKIAAGKVVAWFEGGSEFGPRALGNRSILADPRMQRMKDHLNKKIKFREPFRPYAPAVLAERASEYFECNDESPFMLTVAPVRAKYRKMLPAITHVDGSARLETVKRDDNPMFYDLIEEFGRQTGTPVLLNTSFNIKGFPIVETPADAISSFLHSEIDYLVIGGILVRRELYKNEDLLKQHPFSVVRIECDRGEKQRYFFYDVQRQETVVIKAVEKNILELCNGKNMAGDIISQLGLKEDRALDMIREFLRNQWLTLPATYA